MDIFEYVFRGLGSYMGYDSIFFALLLLVIFVGLPLYFRLPPIVSFFSFLTVITSFGVMNNGIIISFFSTQITLFVWIIGAIIITFSWVLILRFIR